MGPSTDLLTASESNAFSSFLSAMDSFDPSATAGLGLSAEWTMYQQQQHHHGGMTHNGGGYSGMGGVGGKEDLARATKDLISIGFGGEERHELMTRNARSSMGSSHHMHYSSVSHQQRHPIATTYMTSNGQFAATVGSNGGITPNQSYLQAIPHNSSSWPSIPDPSSAHRTGLHSLEQRLGMASPSSMMPTPQNGGEDKRPTLAAISLTFPQGSDNGRSSSSSTSSSATPRSLATPVSATASRKRPSLDLRLDLRNVNPTELDLFSNKRLRFSPTATPAVPAATVSLSNDSKPAGPSASPAVSRKQSNSTSRPSHHKTGSSSSRSKSISSVSEHLALQQQKPATASISSAASSSSSATAQAPGSPSSASASSKQPQLLSNSQKKLNHIHSEQKRRANIRRGYDSLCDVVPALRDAIIAEDKECERTGRKRGRGRLLGDDGEKLDGRAGPRSESVVLQKSMLAFPSTPYFFSDAMVSLSADRKPLTFTRPFRHLLAIEYMMELLDSRASLLDRLAAARAALPPHDPAFPPTGHSEAEPRPWERIWDGGIGLPAGGLGDGADGEGEDGSEGEWDGEDCE
ncbi:hypothetical protein FRB96_009350 [Tulasnella sp. 330]|nr:hypothetical protein FRB96_009350 [Tulasnella sp. 330]